MEAWFNRDPERLDAEIEAFRSRGIAAEPDPTERARDRIVISVAWPSGDGPVDLVIAYPDTFPHLRPEVYAPTLALGRHQNPFGKNLCLLDRSTRAWDSWLTAAELIEEQLPKVLRTQSATAEERVLLEVAQGEPITEFFGGAEGAVVFLPESILAIPNNGRTGQMHIRLAGSRPHPALSTRPPRLLLVCRPSVGRGRRVDAGAFRRPRPKRSVGASCRAAGITRSVRDPS